MAHHYNASASNLTTAANSLKDFGSKHSLDESAEAEKGIEEAFKPPHDEETGPQHVTQDEKDSDLVDWDGPNDPENPQNMPRWKKWWISMISAAMTFVVSFGSSVFSTATVVTAEEFGASNELMILGVSLYVVGFACGRLMDSRNLEISH